jgi:hypothetical protein
LERASSGPRKNGSVGGKSVEDVVGGDFLHRLGARDDARTTVDAARLQDANVFGSTYRHREHSGSEDADLRRR